MWLLLAMVTLSISASAQTVTLSGIILEEGSDKPIPFVNVWITHTPLGTSTNGDGGFEIKIPQRLANNQHTLSISSIGYQTRKIKIPPLLEASPVTIRLKSNVTNLSGVVVQSERMKKKNANRARKLVQDALRRISRNYPKNPYGLNTFYRHYCSENDNYVRLIEAAVDIYSPKNDFQPKEVPDERLAFKIRQLRRSFDFTENARIFHPAISLNYLWTNDITGFTYHNPLSEALTNYEFQIIDTTNLDQEKVYVVTFSDQRTGNLKPQTWYKGTLYIIKKDLAFVRTEIHEIKEKVGVRDSVYSSIIKRVNFKPFKSKYFVDRLTSEVNVLHATMDSTRAIIDTLRHKSRIEMIANNIHTEDPEIFEGKEPRKRDLRKIEYDSTFWQHYTVLKATALEAKIIADLSDKISLQQQFKTINTIEGGGTSIVESSHFQKLIADHQGTPLYVVLWSNWGQLNYLDLQPVNYFKRMLKKDKMKLLLIAVEEDEQDWVNNRKYYGLDNPLFSHERISLGFDSEVTKSYFNNIFPFYLSVDKQGVVQKIEPPLPNKEEVKPYIKSLLRNTLMAEQ